MSITVQWRRPAFAEIQMVRQADQSQASGNCSFPRAVGRARTCASPEGWGVPGKSEPHAGGEVDRLGWGSNAGTAPAWFRPPPQPVLQTAPSQRLGPTAGVLGPQDPSTSGRSPCPGTGGRTSAARTSDAGLRCALRKILLLVMHAETPPGPPLSRLGPQEIRGGARQ